MSTPSAALATWLLDELVARGLTDVVLCPGSRNAPLSFALLADARIRLHTRIDERTAAFLALGLAKASRRPVAVVTTSGTAAANLHPAVLEAAHAGVTLVAVTADRPARLRGTGANQTTDQVRLFGDAASFADLSAPDDDALDAAWHPDGPIHLNVQLDAPLVPAPGGVSTGSTGEAGLVSTSSTGEAGLVSTSSTGEGGVTGEGGLVSTGSTGEGGVTGEGGLVSTGSTGEGGLVSTGSTGEGG